ncbi:MAG: hypothetical protein J5511_01285 [Bacilli bacterium]|nr:hypothetical protein [Bacilli bacterium]
MKIKYSIIPLVCSLVLVGCKTSGVKADDKIKFTSKEMTTYLYTDKSSVKTEVFFRDDILKELPYISLKTYYNLLTNHELTIVKSENHVYTVTSANGEVATIDTANDTLSCADYQNFISTTIYRQDNVPNVYFDGAPFLRVKNVTSEKQPVAKNIDFKKYNINLIGRDNDIYLPLATASNLFMGPTMITCFFTPDAIYFIDPNDPTWETGSLMQHSPYFTGLNKTFKSKVRTEDEARFSYGELCFLIDTYYGLPGREYLHAPLKETRDLDKTLNEFNDVTRQARTFLRSTNYAEYLAGIKMLDAFLSDAGHSVVGLGTSYYLNHDSSLNKDVNNVLKSINFNEYQYKAASNIGRDYISGLYGARQSGPSVSNNGYVLQGDTLFYRFDQFDFDINLWNKYYSKGATGNLPKDGVGNFRKMLETYNGNSTVKNVVVDISLNPGGFGDIVCAFMGLMNQDTYQCSYDTIGERLIKVNYEFDKNFDGVFDEHDDEVHYDFNFAVLCSGYSFSCGNLLPAQAKESGIALLGDKSGGGSCAVIDAASPEGLYVRLSCQDHLSGIDGTDYEFGVPVDYTLVQNGDFSNFFNINLMSEKISDFYSRG